MTINSALPNSLLNIGNYAFYGDYKLTNCIIPNSVTNIGNWAFGMCSNIWSITMPNSLTSIGTYVFSYCTFLTNATLAKRLTSIGDSAFYGCQRLAETTIPYGVTNIGNSAFDGCIGMTEVYFQGNSPSIIGSFAFNEDNFVAYYLPGMAEWSNSFAGSFPAVLWNPTIQTADGSFGVQNNQFGFNINGTTNIPIVVEANTDLTQPAWTPLLTGTVTNGLFYFSDPQWTNYPARFYCIRSP